MTMAASSSMRQELKAGWRNLAAATIGIGLGIGAYLPVSSLFFNALEAQFGWAKAAAAGATIALPIAALLLPLAGWLIDRFGVRLVAGLSSVLAVISYLWLANLHGSVKEFYVASIILNVFACATGPVAYTRLVAGQFRLNRGFALAVAQFGIAFIAVLMPQFIGKMIEGYGAHGGYLFFAGAMAVGFVGSQILMQPAKTETGDMALMGEKPKQAAKSTSFWFLGFAILLINAAAFGLITHFRTILEDHMIGLGVTTALLSLFAVSVMVSRLIVGRLLDLPRPALTAAGAMLLAAIGALLMLTPSAGLPVLTLAVFLMGFSIGAELDLMSFFCARLFGLRHYAAIYGFLSIFFYFGIGIGANVFGKIRSASGSYDAALLMAAVFLCLAAGLFFLVGRQKPISDTQVSGVTA